MTLRERILAVLDDHADWDAWTAKKLSPWCGCAEGDTSDSYKEAREQAADALLALFAEAPAG